MALSDDCPIKITAPDYRPSHRSELGEWLAKEAEGGIKPEDNEDAAPVRGAELQDEPKGRKDGSNHDGSWGEPPHMARGRQEPFHQNDTTYEKSVADRRGVAGRAFATMPAAERADRAFLGKHFEHARTGDFTARALLLQGKTKEGSATLSERVRGILDRF